MTVCFAHFCGMRFFSGRDEVMKRADRDTAENVDGAGCIDMGLLPVDERMDRWMEGSIDMDMEATRNLPPRVHDVSGFSGLV